MQVPRILNPVVLVLDELPRVAAKDPAIKQYIEGKSALGGGADGPLVAPLVGKHISVWQP